MADVVTGEAVVLDVRTAHLPTRIAAAFVDFLAQIAVLAAIFGVAGGQISAIAANQSPSWAASTVVTVVLAVLVGYPVLVETLSRGSSLGKVALGLRIVGTDGGPERFRQALLRALIGVVEIWLTFGVVALFTSLLSQHGKRLGDIFAGTVSVRERMPVQGGPVATMPPQLAGWAAGLELSRLPDDLALSARQFMSRYHELAPGARGDMAPRLASAIAAHVSPAPPAGTTAPAYISAVLAERRRREGERLGGTQPYGYPPVGTYGQAPSYGPAPGAQPPPSHGQAGTPQAPGGSHEQAHGAAYGQAPSAQHPPGGQQGHENLYPTESRQDQEGPHARESPYDPETRHFPESRHDPEVPPEPRPRGFAPPA